MTVFRFGPFELNDDLLQLREHGQVVGGIEPQTMKLLVLLLHNQGRVVNKLEIAQAFEPEPARAARLEEVGWSDGTIYQAVRKGRALLHDDSRNPRYIKLVRSLGYYFDSVDSAQVDDVQFTQRNDVSEDQLDGDEELIGRLSPGAFLPSSVDASSEVRHSLPHISALLNSYLSALIDRMRADMRPQYMLQLNRNVPVVSQRVRVIDPSIDYGTRFGGERFAYEASRMGKSWAFGAQNLSDVPQHWESVEGTLRIGVLIGQPGVGKSWLLRSEAIRQAEVAMSLLASGHAADQVPLPIFAKLDELAALLHRSQHGNSAHRDRWAPVSVVAEFVGNDYGAVLSAYGAEAKEGFLTWIQGRLASDLAVWLLDDLDSVLHQHRSLRYTQFMAALPTATIGKVYVTSRPSGYEQPFVLDSSLRSERKIEVAPFTHLEMRRFVFAWYEGEPGRAHAVWERISDSRALSGLAASPRMLSLMCFAGEAARPLPTVRSDLLDTVLRLLLAGGSWREAELTAGSTDPIGVAARMKFLYHLAGEQHASGAWPRLFSTEEALTMVSTALDNSVLRDQLGGAHANTVLSDLVRCGVFTRENIPAKGQHESTVPYRWSDESIRAFCLARYLLDHCDPALRTTLLVRTWDDPTWTDCWLFVSELCAQGRTELVSQMCETVLAAGDLEIDDVLERPELMCLSMASATSRPQAILAGQVSAWAAQRLCDGSRPDLRRRILNILSEAGMKAPTGVAETLVKELSGHGAFAGAALRHCEMNDSIRAELKEVARNGSWTARVSALVALTGGPIDDDVRSWIAEALREWSEGTPWEAARALEAAATSSVVKDALLAAATSTRDYAVAAHCFRALHRSFGEPPVLDALIQTVTDSDTRFRRTRQTTFLRHVATTVFGLPEATGILPHILPALLRSAWLPTPWSDPVPTTEMVELAPGLVPHFLEFIMGTDDELAGKAAASLRPYNSIDHIQRHLISMLSSTSLERFYGAVHGLMGASLDRDACDLLMHILRINVGPKRTKVFRRIMNYINPRFSAPETEWSRDQFEVALLVCATLSSDPGATDDILRVCLDVVRSRGHVTGLSSVIMANCCRLDEGWEYIQNFVDGDGAEIAVPALISDLLPMLDREKVRKFIITRMPAHRDEWGGIRFHQNAWSYPDVRSVMKELFPEQYHFWLEETQAETWATTKDVEAVLRGMAEPRPPVEVVSAACRFTNLPDVRSELLRVARVPGVDTEVFRALDEFARGRARARSLLATQG